MAQPNNIFEHHHHTHDGPDEPRQRGDMDAAQQSLADALRVSFRILKYSMVAVLVIYAFSGIFTVKPQKKAVRLFLGQIIGDGEAQVKGPGGPYLGLPYPLMEVVEVPTTEKSISLNKEFWFDTAGMAESGKITDEMAAGHQGPLNPEKDGSLLTGDANIVHARWSITYQVIDAIKYVTYVGTEALAEHAVRDASEQGIVAVTANLTADEIINGLSEAEKKQYIEKIQKSLEQMETGIKVINLTLTSPTVPLSVREAYREVNNAQAEMSQAIEQARQERAKILGDAAGEAAEPVLALVDQYESAWNIKDQKQIEDLDKQMDGVFRELKIAELTVGGRVAESINGAKTYRTQVVEQVRADAVSFAQLLPLWEQNPRIVRSRIWLTAKEEILSGDVETIYLPPGQVYLELNRDPKVRRMMEEQKLRADQMARQQAAMEAARSAPSMPSGPPPGP